MLKVKIDTMGKIDVNDIDNYAYHIRDMNKQADSILNQQGVDYELEETIEDIVR